jgi:hypothetical protein
VGSITAVSSSLGEKISNMWIAYSEICCYNHGAPILGSAQQNISLFSLLLLLAVQNRLVQWLGNAGHTIFAVVFLCKFVSLVGGTI